MGAVSLSSKLALVNAALDKMSISGITAPPESSDYSALLQRLEGLMYELEEGRNICCQYNFTSEPDTGDPHGMSYGLFEPISSLLAFKTLQDYALPIAQPLQASVASAISSISNQTFELRETQYPRRQPRGSGNTLRYNRWQRFYRMPDRTPIDCDSFRLNTDEINDYSEDYFNYLQSRRRHRQIHQINHDRHHRADQHPHRRTRLPTDTRVITRLKIMALNRSESPDNPQGG